MAWRRARFKDSEVWVEVDPVGQPLVKGGRVPIRYSDKQGARIYGGGLASLGPLEGAAVELPPGEGAPSGGAKGAPSGGAGGAAGRGGTARGSGFGSAGTRNAEQARAAKSSAEELIEGLPAGAALAFTDGACQGNPGPAGAGCVLKLPDGRRVEAWLALGTGTNNQGELAAIGLALDLADEVGFDGPLHILTDSGYSRGVLSQGWKAKANVEQIAALKARLLRRRPTLHWIAGHVGLPENERADQLANLGVEQSRCSPAPRRGP